MCASFFDSLCDSNLGTSKSQSREPAAMQNPIQVNEDWRSLERVFFFFFGKRVCRSVVVCGLVCCENRDRALKRDIYIYI